MGENICKRYNWQGFNFQNRQTVHIPQQQKTNTLIKKWAGDLSLPVYFYSIPGNMKCLIDRFNAFDVGNIDISDKSYAIISCCEDEEMSSFDGIRIPLERTAKFFGWNLLDEVLAPSMLRRGDIDNTDGIRRCKDLADKII